MKILFLCTAHNSFSQQLFLALCRTHSITIEYALSDQVMVEAATLAQPDIIICPFLTSRVPCEIYTKYLTLVVHPGPPGDAGPSAIDWVLMGDDGTVSEFDQLLQAQTWSRTGRSHWGVTVLQAVAELDAGPVWAFEQFEINIDAPGVTKSTLYRGPVTRAAITATLAALDRILTAANQNTCSYAYTPSHPAGYEKHCLSATSSAMLPQTQSNSDSVSTLIPLSGPMTVSASRIFSRLLPDPAYRLACVTKQLPFLGGATHRRPLLKAAHRGFDVRSETARDISRKLRSADSQPGCLTRLFDEVSLYVYGGTIEEGRNLVGGYNTECEDYCDEAWRRLEPGRIIACRDGAICIATSEGMGIWITHVRQVKRKADAMLWPKVPAVYGLRNLGLLDHATLSKTLMPRPTVDWSKARHSTHQEIWVDFVTYSNARHVAFVYFEFYNGAMSTEQCSRLIEALEFVSYTHIIERPLSAVVLMGGDSYFSNGIALNVIEASPDPAAESWRNINRIDDVVHILLEDFPRRKILTIAALRGNCAAGGVAMAAACDVMIAGLETVLNPAYRALGLHGSEFHSLTYGGRCGVEGAKRLLRDMLPLSPYAARDMGLVDHTLPGSGSTLDTRIRNHVGAMVCTPGFRYLPGNWKVGVDVSPAGLAAARAEELGEMAKDFWSARSERYHSRRRDFVRKVKPVRTPLRFASHRRHGGVEDEEESDAFDDVTAFEKLAVETMVKSRMPEMETQARQNASLPLSPASSPGQMNCCKKDMMTSSPLPSIEVRPQRDLESVFTCYYDPAG
ncbi:hydrogenase maturation factor hoxX [Mariannaea sp. PMI_226]|nr:hydrogenase maturation factor hoxX [Mariannaea sp. PMI_226]